MKIGTNLYTGPVLKQLELLPDRSVWNPNCFKKQLNGCYISLK